MSIWETVAAPIVAIINKVVPDKSAAAAAVAQLQQMQLNGELQDELLQLQAVTTNQTDINKIEAASSSLWVAGWRPYIGWICGTALALTAIVGPLLTWVTSLCGHPTPFPALPPILDVTLGGMLGLGHASRTYEKKLGIAS